MTNVRTPSHLAESETAAQRPINEFPYRHSRERGSALLIVFLFAAIVAIMLYREMPIAVFEAKRQKEQMLIDRGNQYKRAVKLFYRKFGMYPASIQQLEDTNRMRFLRHRFKDPFTGKDDWRLLHMGPGGMLVDSKVNPLKPGNQNGQPSAFGNNSSFGANSNSLASSSFGSNSSSANAGPEPVTNTPGSPQVNLGSAFSNGAAFPEHEIGEPNNAASQSEAGSPSGNDQTVMVAPVPRRGPAIPANVPLPTTATANDTSAEEGSTAEGSTEDQAAQSEQEAGTPGEEGESNPSQPTGVAQASGQQSPGQPAGAAPGAQAGQSQIQNGDQTGANATGAAGAQGRNTMQAIRSLLANPTPQQASIPSGFRIANGGLAGVASKAQGHTVKLVNDQSDYSLWEFYYDPNKDTRQVMPTGMQPQNQNTFGNNSNAAGSFTRNQSSFGQSSFNQGAFGPGLSTAMPSNSNSTSTSASSSSTSSSSSGSNANTPQQ